MRMLTRHLLPALAVSSLALVTAIPGALAQDAAIDKVTPVTDEMLQSTRRRLADVAPHLQRLGLQPLDQINKENVGKLQLAWAWA